MKKTQILSLGFLISFVALAETAKFKGTLYEIGSNRQKPLFLFTHEDEIEKGIYKSMYNDFKDLEGKDQVTEKLSFDSAGNLQKLVLDQMQTGEKGELEIKDGKAYFQWTKDGKTKTADEKFVPNLVVAATLVPYLQNHFDTLLKGKDVDVRFAALDRRETVGFKYFKVEDKKWNGRDAVVIKMKPTSFIIAAIVDPLYFTFDKETKKIVDLVGRTAPKKKVGKNWEDLDVEIVYDYPDLPAAVASPASSK